MTTYKEKPTSLAEEREAAELEKKRPTAPISVSGLKRVQHVHLNNAKIKELKAENDLAKVYIFAEMDKRGVDVLTRKGVEVVSRDDFNVDATEFDVEKFEHDYPNLFKQYQKPKKPGKRINWKSLFGL